MTPLSTTGAATVFEGISGVSDVGILGSEALKIARTTPGELRGVLGELKDRGFTHLSLLTAAELPIETPGVKMVYAVTRRTDQARAMLTVDLPEGELRIPTICGLWSGAATLEREVFDLFGIVFLGHPNLRPIVLRDDFPGHPLRKGFAMKASGVDAEDLAWALSSHGDNGPDPTPERSDPSLNVTLPYPLVADAIRAEDGSGMHSEREILNMGPQHPSMHGVLHLWLALEGEKVLAGEVTHGYLHRCIEKLAETRSYRAVTALVDRADYVSGFFTELALLTGVEELAGIEVTPKAQYLRVLMSELCRLTSHTTWMAACGIDVGAFTPMLFSFRDREAILDFFEEVTGGRMMFNYFRPGGVKSDLPAGAANRLRAYLKTVDASIDGYEALLTNNEIFRNRTRGIGVMSPELIVDFGVTGPMARGSGVNIDLRRDEPYAAYGDFDVHVPLGHVGDTYDRYAVRILEMRESARLALQALDGMPEGDFVTPGVPRAVKPPAGAAYKRVESPRGELGVYLESDGTAQPWRMKIRSPAFSNLHVTPAVIPGGRIGDIIAIMSSVDVVMGEIDR
ncbi:MAG: NADH-quinone oxidoreductase subunit D [Coriobacteriia bacterium]|nr:NADH-quinone oxidoreductase subunit D [Coriobacteriia bacterium]